VIDPLQAVIQHLKNDAALAELVGSRIAAKHKFATSAAGSPHGWTTPSQALQIGLVSGAQPDLYGGTFPVRLEVRAYGASQLAAGEVLRALLAAVEATARTVVPLPGGMKALLYYLVADTSPVFLMDPELSIDMALIYLRASVAQQAVM
jgi:hypothetical protein